MLSLGFVISSILSRILDTVNKKNIDIAEVGFQVAFDLIEFRIISRQSKQREDCFQKAVTKRGLRCMRRSARRARRLNCP